MADTYLWLDYHFLIEPPFITSFFKGRGGVYVFAKPARYDGWLSLRTGPTRIFAERLRQEVWVPLYVGIATDLGQRLNLDRRAHWTAAQRLGATHVHLRVEPSPFRRAVIERQLVEEFDPPVNQRLRKKRAIRSGDL